MDIKEELKKPYVIVGAAGVGVLAVVLFMQRGSSAATATPVQYVGAPQPAAPTSASGLPTDAGTGTAAGATAPSLAQELSDVTGLVGAVQQLQQALGAGSSAGSSAGSGSTVTPTPQPAPLLPNASQGYTYAQWIGDLRSNPYLGQNAQQQQHWWDVFSVGRQFLPQDAAYQGLIAQGAGAIQRTSGLNAQAAYQNWVNQLGTYEAAQTAAEQAGTAPVVAVGAGSATGYRQYVPGQADPASGGTTAPWGPAQTFAGGGGGVSLHARAGNGHLGTARDARMAASRRTVLAPFRPSDADLIARGWLRYQALAGMQA